MCLFNIRQRPTSFDGAVDVGLYNTGLFQYDLVGWEVTKFIRRSPVVLTIYRWHAYRCVMQQPLDVNEM